LCLHFLVCASCMCGCPLVSPQFLWVGTCFGLLRAIDLFLLLLFQLHLILLLVLGPYLHFPFICLCCFSLARSSSHGNLDFLRLCFFLPYLFFYCCFRQCLGDGSNPPFIFPIFDYQVNVTLFDAVAHL
jgi:hypothetical protein